MATFRSFRDIDAWQAARELTNRIYLVTRAGSFAKDFVLRDQICRASISIMANIAEGFGRSGSGEFIQFLSVAKGSACELSSHLSVAFDQGYICEAEFESLDELANRTLNLIGGLMKYLRQSSLRGAKYKRLSQVS